ncbi:hypothetical protein [Streptomyces sp. Wb2n-11]|uniref:hypothetical protein n=1 Tax=Streptomyces sp. Wb2n-11 TaxID=1030533 RepID=UPI000B1F779D|nr:hypothetical protein [Streptomyces sp. Wb2n-11]
MRTLLISLGALVGADTLTVGLDTPVSAPSGTPGRRRAGRITTYTDPALRACVSAFPGEGGHHLQ